MVIYKIVDDVENKIYVGQTTKSVKERFSEHCREALSGRLDTALSYAIRKYGPEHFHYFEIEKVTSSDLLDERESYWIKQLKSSEYGYNMTIGGKGGNTYLRKSISEMSDISEKIRQTKVRQNNPNHRKIKCKSIKSEIEMHFNSMIECQLYFKEKDHSFLTRRVAKDIPLLFKGEWIFAYEEDEFSTKYSENKRNRKSRKIHVLDSVTGFECDFPSYAAAERHFMLRNKTFSNKAFKVKSDNFTACNRYNITII